MFDSSWEFSFLGKLKSILPTGLDPAGPRFIDGPLVAAIPALYAQRLTAQSAAFVDVMHTNGDLRPAGMWVSPHCGDLHQLGSMDFYPSGGSQQPGCQLGGTVQCTVYVQWSG